MSPSFTRKHGDTCTARFECLFSYLQSRTASCADKVHNSGNTIRNAHSGYSARLQYTLVHSRNPLMIGKLRIPEHAAVTTWLQHIPSILLDVVDIIPSYNDGLVHFCGPDNARQDTPTNGDVASEWALLVNVCACKAVLLTLCQKGTYSPQRNVSP